MGESRIAANKMSIGLARRLNDGPQLINDGQGLVGIGYWINQAGLSSLADDLTEGPKAPTLTLVQAMVDNGDIEREAYSIYLNDADNGTGTVIFGGVDSTKYEGDLVALQTLPDAVPNGYTNYTHFEVALTGIGVTDDDGDRLLTPTDFAEPGLLDSGTTLTYVPASIYKAIAEGFGVSFGWIPCRYRNSAAALTYHFGGPGGPVIRVPLSELIDIDIGVTFDDDDRTPACSFLVDQFEEPYVMLGNSFMRSGYFVYDLENHVVAVAQVRANATSDDPEVIPSGTTIPGCDTTNTYTIANRVASPTVEEVIQPTIPNRVEPAEPTFALGDLSASGGSGSGGSGGSSSQDDAAVSTRAALGLQAVMGLAAVAAVMAL